MGAYAAHQSSQHGIQQTRKSKKAAEAAFAIAIEQQLS
jgi:hypothetical protein